MENRKDFLINLLYQLWTDQDFENDFMGDWYAIYQLLQDGDFNKIPDAVLNMIAVWEGGD